MRKTKMQKGITLIALIITIVILLILAVVAIQAVTGDGIIFHAENATSMYKEAQVKEQDMLEYYGALMQGTVGSWTQEGATLTRINADGTKTQIKIGDYVDYNEGSYTHTPVVANGAGTSKMGGSSTAGYTLSATTLTTQDLKWRVLGLNEKGEIELISADPTTQTLYLANDEGYVNAEDNLKNFCNDLYGKGTYATGARSLKVEDIDNLTNYDKTTYSGYGNKWTYKYPIDEEVSASTTGLTKNMWYRTDKADGTVVKAWTNITSSSYQKFRLPNEEKGIGEISDSEIIEDKREVEYTKYTYPISSNLTTDDGYTSDEATAISNMITKGNGSTNLNQWLASSCVSADNFCASFSVLYLSTGEITYGALYKSYEKFYCSGYRVRPVVSLSSDVIVTTNGTANSESNMWTLSK